MNIVILGHGGHAKVVTEILDQHPEYKISGYVVDESVPKKGNKIIGTDRDLKALFEGGIHFAFVAIGDNRIRLKLSDKLRKLGFQLINVISKDSIISQSARLGTGIVVMPGAIINADATIGDDCIINTNASVDHDCIVGNGVHIAPGVAVSGSTNIGPGSFLGTGCRVIDNIDIGANVIVGAGAVVIDSLKSDKIYIGVPAKELLK